MERPTRVASKGGVEGSKQPRECSSIGKPKRKKSNAGNESPKLAILYAGKLKSARAGLWVNTKKPKLVKSRTNDERSGLQRDLTKRERPTQAASEGGKEESRRPTPRTSVGRPHLANDCTESNGPAEPKSAASGCKPN